MVDSTPGVPAEAFRGAWDAHHQRVRQYVARRVAVDDIDELTAQVFEVVWRRWADVPSGEAQLWWILATARRTTSNYYRGRTRRGNLVQRLGARRTVSVDDAGWASVESVVVREVLAELSDTDREVLLLSVWDDLEVSAIASVLGVSVDAAQKRLVRARERFKVLYEKSEQSMSDDNHTRTLSR